jgi:streptogramin lyase
MNEQNWDVDLLAGSTTGASGYVNASGVSARFSYPRGLCVGRDGTVYVADSGNHCIRAITPDGDVSTFAGTDTPGYLDATGTAARFNSPYAVAVGPDDYLYIQDTGNDRVRRASPGGVVTTVSGTGASTFTDGRGDESAHNTGRGIAVGPSGDVYCAENACVRVIERIIDVGDTE